MTTQKEYEAILQQIENFLENMDNQEKIEKIKDLIHKF
jgi:hypothetical protein